MVGSNGIRLEGVMPAVVTPFDKHKEFDEEAFRTFIDWLVEMGITGIIPCGTRARQRLSSLQGEPVNDFAEEIKECKK